LLVVSYRVVQIDCSLSDVHFTIYSFTK